MDFIAVIHWLMTTGQLMMHQIGIEAMSFVEKAEFLENTFHIATGYLVVGIFPSLVFLHFVGRHFQLFAALVTESGQIFFGLNRVIVTIMDYVMIMSRMALLVMGRDLKGGGKEIYKFSRILHIQPKAAAYRHRCCQAQNRNEYLHYTVCMADNFSGFLYFLFCLCTKASIRLFESESKLVFDLFACFWGKGRLSRDRQNASVF